MTGTDTVSIALLLSVISLICTLINTFGGQNKRRKDDIEAEIERRTSMKEEFVKVNFKLDAFCSRLDDMIKRFDKTEEKLNDHERRITALEKGEA